MVGGFELSKELGFTGKIGTWSTLSEKFEGHNQSADIQVSKDGRFLYVSNRGPDDIGTFSIDQKIVMLEKIGNIASGG